MKSYFIVIFNDVVLLPAVFVATKLSEKNNYTLVSVNQDFNTLERALHLHVRIIGACYMSVSRGGIINPSAGGKSGALPD